MGVGLGMWVGDVGWGCGGGGCAVIFFSGLKLG